jgi:hypothetical protein
VIDVFSVHCSIGCVRRHSCAPSLANVQSSSSRVRTTPYATTAPPGAVAGDQERWTVPRETRASGRSDSETGASVLPNA